MKRIAIIGAGPGGICAGIRLKQAGYNDFVILEQADSIGGTWWHNSYPGCRCDVPSYLYSFSFALKNDWSEPYATQAEILAYLRDCVDRFGLAPHIRLGTRIEAAHWHGDSASWMLHTSEAEVLSADILVSAVGLFNLPAYPDIPGLSAFEGSLMHSARWDHGKNLQGEAVAVIGTAASAVQFIPEIAPAVGRLDIYQRTPNYVSPRENEFSEEQRKRFLGDPSAVLAERQQIWNWLNAVVTLQDAAILAGFRQAFLENLAQVRDPALRQKLLPDYPFGSKRGLVSSDWYPTFNRSNVNLITDPISAITCGGIVSGNGEERAVDTIILATGFQATKFLSAIEVTGSNGVTLSGAWAEGATAYLGITVAGFPNLFMLYGPNTNNGSIMFNIECQVDYLLRHLQRMSAGNLRWIDVKPEAMADYNHSLQQDIGRVEVWHAGVSDYYRSESGLIVTQWPHGMDRYREITSAPDDEAYLCDLR